MPTTHFGPWTTSLDDGSRLELSAFWRCRMGQLAHVAQQQRNVWHPSALMALWIGLAFLGTPLIYGEIATLAVANDREASPALPRPADESVRRLRASLKKEVDFDFIDLPLSDCLAFLSRELEIPIEFDKTTPQTASASPVTWQGKRVTTGSSLTVFTQPLALDWYIDGNRVVIAPVREVDRRVEEWIYDVSDFARAGITPVNLMEVFIGTIEPESWQSVGGPGTIKPGKEELRILQTRGVREQIDGLLAELRRISVRRGDETAIRLVERTHSLGALPLEEISAEQTETWLRDHFLPSIWKEHGGDATLTVKEGTLTVQSEAWVHETFDRVLSAYLDDLKTELPRTLMGSTKLSTLSRRSGMQSVASVPEWAGELAARFALQRRRSFSFTDIPLEEALNAICLPDGMQSFIGGYNLKDAESLRKTPVSLTIEDRPLSQILEDVLRPLDLDWLIIGGGPLVLVTKPDPDRHPAHRIALRVYDVRRLLTDKQDVHALARRLVAEFDPERWSDSGGQRTIHSLAGALIVGAERPTHEKIENWLDSVARPRK